MCKLTDKQITERIDQGVHLGVIRALAEHKKAGRSIVVWKNGKIVEIPPEKIKISKCQ
ncbi:MAG: hypothetical protein JW855_03155 [Gammaproteobacteria bacterium]|nr:hypothetical protein [Gammaproteobacteria bacterium]